MKIDVTGIDEVNEQLRGLSSRIKDRVVKRFAQCVFDEAREGADEHTKTGTMKRSLTLRKQSQDSYRVGHDLQHAPHASFVHWGTKRHVIKPKNRKVLRWASGGKFIFAGKVNHPGYKGDPYLCDAVDTCKSKLADIIKNVSTE